MGRPPGPRLHGTRGWYPPVVDEELEPRGIAGSTQLITNAGLRPIGELTRASPLHVLGADGSWVEAGVRLAGAAEAWEVTLVRNRAVHVVRASASQLWPVNSGARRFNDRAPLPFRTNALLEVAGSPSWKLVTVNPQAHIQLDPSAVLHGIVFGDGTLHRQPEHSGRKASCHVYLCNDPHGCDSRRLAPFFERAGFRPVIRQDLRQVRFYGLPQHWKRLPPDGAAPQYLRGFVAGWFAADGHVDPRATVALLASVKREHLEWLQRIAPVAGLAVSTKIGIRTSQSTFGPSTWCSLGLSASTLDADFFLSPEKLARFHPAQFVKQWKVVSVRRTDDSELVYTVNAAGSRCVIEGNILINCD